MARDTGRPSLIDKPNSDRNHADTQKSSIVSEDVRSLAAGLAQKLREANIDCEILPVVPIPTTAVRRDRVLAVLGLTFLTASAWASLTWISVDMAMGGMDMAGYRMIPSGIGLMMPSDRPWQPIEFAFVFAMWVVMMAAMMTPSAAPMILVYARVGQFIETRTTPLVATVCFGAATFSFGPLSRCSLRRRNGRSNAPRCLIPRWQAPAMSSAPSCSLQWVDISGPG